MDHLRESSSRAHKVSPEHGNRTWITSAKAALGHINLPLTDGCCHRLPRSRRPRQKGKPRAAWESQPGRPHRILGDAPARPDGPGEAWRGEAQESLPRRQPSQSKHRSPPGRAASPGQCARPAGRVQTRANRRSLAQESSPGGPRREAPAMSQDCQPGRVLGRAEQQSSRVAELCSCGSIPAQSELGSE